MSEEIKVNVNSYGDKRPLSLVYFDPVSGKKIAKSQRYDAIGGKPSDWPANWKRNCGPVGTPRQAS